MTDMKTMTVGYFAGFRADYIVFVIVLVFAVIFERAVIPVPLEENGM